MRTCRGGACNVRCETSLQRNPTRTAARQGPHLSNCRPRIHARPPRERNALPIATIASPAHSHPRASGPRRGPGATALLGSATALLAAGALAGCGSSGAGTDADPATVTPASTPLYAKLAIKPSGGAKGTASSAAKTLTHLTEPYGSLAQALLAAKAAISTSSATSSRGSATTRGVFITSLDTSRLPTERGSAQALLEGGLSSAGAAPWRRTPSAPAVRGRNRARHLRRGRRSFVPLATRPRTGSPRGELPGRLLPGVPERSRRGHRQGLRRDRQRIGLQERGGHLARGRSAITNASGYAKPPENAIASVYVRPEALTKAVHGSSGVAGQGSLADRPAVRGRPIGLSVGDPDLQLDLAAGRNPLRRRLRPPVQPGRRQGARGDARAEHGSPRAWEAGAEPTYRARWALLRGVASFGSSTVFASLGGAASKRSFTSSTRPGETATGLR